MLKLAAYPAECFGTDAEVRSDMAQRYSFQDMRRLQQKILIPLGSRFKLGIHKTFFQPDIIFFVGDPHQSFDFVILVEQRCKFFF